MKHPRAATASGVVREAVRPESSQAIADPDVRAKWRAEQDDETRLGKLEKKHDKLAEDHQDLEVSVAGRLGNIEGQLATAIPMIQASDDERKARRQREIDAGVALEKQRVRRAAWWRGFFKVLGSVIGGVVTAYGIYKGVSH
jgi:hypothetical protein